MIPSSSSRAEKSIDPRIAQYCHHGAMYISALGYAHSCSDIRSGRTAYQESFFQHQSPCHGKGLVITDLFDTINYRDIKILWNRTSTYPFHKIGAINIGEGRITQVCQTRANGISENNFDVG